MGTRSPRRSWMSLDNPAGLAERSLVLPPDALTLSGERMVGSGSQSTSSNPFKEWSYTTLCFTDVKSSVRPLVTIGMHNLCNLPFQRSEREYRVVFDSTEKQCLLKVSM